MRILFVVRQESIHASRWINQLSDQGWDVQVFPAYVGTWDANFKNITAHGFRSYLTRQLINSGGPKTPIPRNKAEFVLKREANRVFNGFVNRPKWLAQVIRRLKPDIVHSMEFQVAGYLTLEAKTILKGWFPPWIATSWGSDIYLFGRMPEHVEKIKAVLANCDYFGGDCSRDVKLARAFGFRGEALPVFPGGGGFDIEKARGLGDSLPTSKRRLLVLKGYQHWAGRALVGLRAIELCADALKNYRVAVYLANPDVQIAAELVAQRTGIPIDILPLTIPFAPNEEILRLFGRARVSIGLSISDGLSNSALEAMLMGSFPIQSNTGCLNEWVRDGETAFFVPPEDPEPIAAAIRRAITDDELVDRAAELNHSLVVERLSSSIIKPQVLALYNRILGV